MVRGFRRSARRVDDCAVGFCRRDERAEVGRRRDGRGKRGRSQTARSDGWGLVRARRDGRSGRIHLSYVGELEIVSCANQSAIREWCSGGRGCSQAEFGLQSNAFSSKNYDRKECRRTLSRIHSFRGKFVPPTDLDETEGHHLFRAGSKLEAPANFRPNFSLEPVEHRDGEGGGVKRLDEDAAAGRDPLEGERCWLIGGARVRGRR